MIATVNDLKPSRISAIGQRIRRAREERDWTQTELANRADIPVSYVNKVEHGRISAPSGEYVGKIAAVLGWTTDDLIHGRVPPSDEDDALLRRLIERRLGNRANADLVESILDRLRDYPAVDRNTVLTVVDALLRTLPPHTDR